MNEKVEMITIPKEVWLQLLEAYDKQNSKFISVFKTVIICITIIIVVWLIGYFCLPNVDQNNYGTIQHGDNNNIENQNIKQGVD